jgi:tetratricopeptide (TPR) repeat protein
VIKAIYNLQRVLYFGGKLMKRIFLSILALLFSALILISAVDQVQAADDLAISRDWIGCAVKGYDPYYDKDVFAYKTGSTAILVVTTTADYRPINVSNVIVSFDWGRNYSVSFDPPIKVPRYESRVFTVTLSVPDTSEASNLFLHSYTIFVEHVNNTIEPKRVLKDETFRNVYTPDFAVYSTDQAEAQELSQILSEMPEPSYYYYYYYYYSNEARLLCLRADNETAAGNLSYVKGNFLDAKMHYQNALDLIAQAYSAAASFASKYDTAMLRQYESTANVFSGLSTAMTLIGIATLLFGIGYIIKYIGTLRKTESQAPT